MSQEIAEIHLEGSRKKQQRSLSGQMAMDFYQDSFIKLSEYLSFAEALILPCTVRVPLETFSSAPTTYASLTVSKIPWHLKNVSKSRGTKGSDRTSSKHSYNRRTLKRVNEINKP